jgi:hypothetical protein
MAAMLYNRGWRAKDTKVSEDRRGYDAGKALFEQVLHTPELLAHLGKTSIYGAKVLLNFKGEIATDLNDGLEPKTRVQARLGWRCRRSLVKDGYLARTA